MNVVGMRERIRIWTFFFVLSVLLVSLSTFLKVYAQQAAPDVTLIDIDGEAFSTADFRGTTVILSFVAAPVITCKMQVLVLNNISKYFQDEVVILLVGVGNETLWVGGDNDEQLRQFRDDCGFEGIVARDTRGVADDYNVTFIPTTFIIDQEGYIRHTHVGATQTRESVLLEELQVIVPEFSSTTILVFAMVLSTLAIVKGGRRFC